MNPDQAEEVALTDEELTALFRRLGCQFAPRISNPGHVQDH